MINLYKTGGVITVGEDGKVPVTYYGEGGKSGKFYPSGTSGTMPPSSSIDPIAGSSDGYLSFVSQSLSGLGDSSYEDVPSATSGNGTGATFLVVTSSGAMSALLHYPASGSGYNVGDIITIQGSDMGGEGNLILEVINIEIDGFLINLGGDYYSVKWYDLVIDGTSPTSFSNTNDLLLTFFS